MKTFPQKTDEPTKALLTDIAISPAIFTAGDQIEAACTLQNISGMRLTGYSLQLGYMKKTKFIPLVDLGSGVLGMAHRAVRAIRHSAPVNGDAVDAFVADQQKNNERARNGFMLAITVTDNKMEETTEYVPVDLSVCMIDRRYTPSVQEFALIRRDAEGPKLDLTAKLGTSLSASMSCKLYYAKGHEPSEEDACVDLSDCVDALMDGVKADATMLDGDFDNADDWFFKLVFGDEFEAASAVCVVGQAFTNIHESGYESGGVRFGGFSRSKKGAPLMESDYPGYFYGGIANIQAEVIPAAGMTGPGGCTDIPVVFPHAFKEGTVPVVVAGFESSSTAGRFGCCAVAVLADSVTNTGFKLRFYNGDSAARNPAFTYCAVGIPAPAE